MSRGPWTSTFRARSLYRSRPSRVEDRDGPALAPAVQSGVSPPRSPDIAEQAVAQAEGSGPGAGRPVAAAPGRAHEHAVAAREDVLAAVIHLLAIDTHIAEAAGPAALEA